MSKEQLKNIFDNSACLSPRQLRGYASGKMVHEEAHAVETHLLSCPFCSEAVEGLRDNKNIPALDAAEKLDLDFLEEHLNVSEADLEQGPRYKGAPKFSTLTAPEKTKSKIWKPLAAAATVIALAGVFWLTKDMVFNSDSSEGQIAEAKIIEKETIEPTHSYAPQTVAVDSSETLVAEGANDSMATSQLLADAGTVQEATAAVTEEQREVKPEVIKEKDAPKKVVEEVVAKIEPKKEEVKDNVIAAATPAQNVADAEFDKQYSKRLGNSYVADVEEKKDEVKAVVEEPKPEPKKINLGTARTGIAKADDFFNGEKYKKALKQYQKVMFNPKSNQKDAATFMAAKCHIALGEKTQARTLLNSLIKENSSKKGQAAALLGQLN